MMNEEDGWEIEEELNQLSLNSNTEEEMVKLSSSPTTTPQPQTHDVDDALSAEKTREITPEPEIKIKNHLEGIEEKNKGIQLKEKEDEVLKEEKIPPSSSSKPLQNASSLFQGGSSDLFSTCLSANTNNIPLKGFNLPEEEITSTPEKNSHNGLTTNLHTKSLVLSPGVNSHPSQNFSKIGLKNIDQNISYTNITSNDNPHWQPNSVPKQSENIASQVYMQPEIGFTPSNVQYNDRGKEMWKPAPIPKQPEENLHSQVPSFSQNDQQPPARPTNTFLPATLNQHSHQSASNPTFNKFNKTNSNLQTGIKPPVNSSSGIFVPSMYSPNKPIASTSTQSQFFIPSAPLNTTSQPTITPSYQPSAYEYGHVSSNDHIAFDQSNIMVNSPSNHHDQGFWQWIKNAVNGNFKQQLQKATDSVLTTLDPGMEDYINLTNISIGVASQDISILHGIRQAFTEVFGNIQIKEEGYPPSASSVPRGYDAVVSSINQHLLSSNHLNFGSSSNVSISCMAFMTETTSGSFAISMCLGLKDVNKEGVFRSFSQPISIPKEKESMFQDDYNTQQILNTQEDWCATFTGGYRKFQLVYGAALYLAHQYKTYLKEQKSPVQQNYNHSSYNQPYYQKNPQTQQQRQKRQQQSSPHGHQAYQPSNFPPPLPPTVSTQNYQQGRYQSPAQYPPPLLPQPQQNYHEEVSFNQF